MPVISPDSIEWAEPPEKSRTARRGPKGFIQQFVDTLAQRPGQWGILKRSSKNRNLIPKNRFPEVEWTSAADDDGTYTIYGRWVGDDGSVAASTNGSASPVNDDQDDA